jgi:hypothetical protein
MSEREHHEGQEHHDELWRRSLARMREYLYVVMGFAPVL